MPRRRLAAFGALVTLGLAGLAAWWLQWRPAADGPSGGTVGAAPPSTGGRAPRAPSVTLPPLPGMDPARLLEASGLAARFGALEVCGVGAVAGQWQRPSADANDMTFELPPALGIDAPNAAIDQLVQALQLSDRPRRRAAALMMQREGDAAAALAQLAASSHDPVIAHWAVSACWAGDPQRRPPCATLARRWAQLEPDNAAAWLAVLDGEPAAEAEVMQQVAWATRFDEHLGEVMREAHPALRPEWAPYLRAEVLGHAFEAGAKGLSSYSPLFQHCAPAQLADPDRRQRCEAITELLVGRGRTLLAQKIGLRQAERLGWPERRLAPLRAAHARADEALRAAAARERRHGSHSCEAVEADLRHYQALARDGEWAALSAPRR